MARQQGFHPTRKTTQGGASLTEVLVAMVIISVALLGGVGMQLRALQLGKASEFRNQAILLVGDLAERMEANKTASASTALDGVYAVAETSVAPSSAPSCTTSCTAGEWATLDLYQWQTLITKLLPQSAWAVRQTVHGNPSTYEITVKWADSHGDHAFGTDATETTASYVATRTIYRP